jgi:hypothetical protein
LWSCSTFSLPCSCFRGFFVVFFVFSNFRHVFVSSYSCYGCSLLHFCFKHSSQCSCSWALYCALIKKLLLMWGGAIVQHFKINWPFSQFNQHFFLFCFVRACVLCFCFVVIDCGCLVFLQYHFLPANLKIFCL